MSKKKREGTVTVPSTNEIAKLVRRDWNGINPVTRVVESKKYKKPKYKKLEDWET